MILCHRGISDYFPENTVGSILETFKNTEYYGIEIDIQLTKDNEWIIYHDETLLRLNGLSKEVSKTDYSNINKISWKGNFFPVNLLSELNKITFNRKFILNIEITNYIKLYYQLKPKNLFLHLIMIGVIGLLKIQI